MAFGSIISWIIISCVFILSITRRCYHRKSFTTVAFLCILVHAELVQCFVPESEFIPFSESDGNSRFRFGDDNFREVAFIYSSFKFLNFTYTRTYISGNGLISFSQGHSAAAPDCNVPSGIPIISLFWADANEGVDPQGSKLTYMETTNMAYLSKLNADISRAFPQNRRFGLSWMFVVTWKNVASHKGMPNNLPSYRSKRNTYQLILATNSVNSYVLFYYNQIMWANDGAATAGFDLGSSKRRYSLPGSCQTSIENIVSASNVGVPGKWIFQVDTDVIASAPVLTRPLVCEKEKPVLVVEPPVLPIMGNIPQLVHGLCLEENANVSCIYQDKSQIRPIEIAAVLLPANLVICPVPFLYSLGKMTLNILVSYPGQSPVIHTQSIYVVKEHEFNTMPQITVVKADKMLFLSARWDPELLAMTAVKMADKAKNESNSETVATLATDKHCQILSETVQIVILEYDGKRWKNLGAIMPPILNNGIHMSPVNTSLINTLLPRGRKFLLGTFAIQTKYTLKSGQSVHKLFPSNVLLTTEILIDLTAKLESDATKSDFDKLCQTWHYKEPNLHLDTLPCPNILDQARLDWRFSLDKTHLNTRILNEGATTVYTQSVPSSSGAATQCAYDNDGRLLIWLPSCGRTFRRSPNGVTGYWKHYLDDNLPYMYCCKWGNMRTWDKCNLYFSKRNMDWGTDYVPPRPIRAVGDPHFTTFDGLQYTFNGAGEYWLIKYNDESDSHAINEFKMQVRMQKFIPMSRQSPNATVITAVVMEEIKAEYDVKVQVFVGGSVNGLSILVDGEPLNVFNGHEDGTYYDEEDILSKNDSPWNFQNEFTLYHMGVIIMLKSKNEAVVSFSSGFSFNFLVVNGSALNIVGSAGANLMNKIEGLLGNYDDLISNDFKLRNGTLLETNLTMEDTHKSFGMSWVVKESETIFSYPPGKSYSNFYKPEFSPWLLTPEEVNELSLSDEDFCEDFEDCIFDFLATGSRSIAIGTKGSSALFQEINTISQTIVKQCSQPILPANGFFVGTSYVVGSTLQLQCGAGNDTVNHFEGNDHVITCSYPDGNETSTPTWMNSMGTSDIDVMTCEARDGAMIETKVENKVMERSGKLASQPLPSSSPPSSGGVWIFVIGLAIFAIITVVVIAEYPPCKPVKHYFTDRYYSYRVTRTIDNHIRLN